jgi:hypothetical protein
MHIANYLGMLRNAERQLGEAFLVVGERHQQEHDILIQCKEMSEWSRANETSLAPSIGKYGLRRSEDPEHIRGGLFHGGRLGGFGLLRDLSDLLLLATAAKSYWTILLSGATALHDKELEAICTRCSARTARQIEWVETRIKHAAPQALVVKPDRLQTLKASLPRKLMPAALFESLWSPAAAAALVLAVGLIGWAAGKAWILPSIGPTAYLLAHNPAQPASRFWNIVVGHLGGMLAGFAGVWLTNAWMAPNPMLTGGMPGDRIIASVIALALTLLILTLLRAHHPPAGATTLLVSLGTVNTFGDARQVVYAVALIAALGEVARRSRLLKWPLSLAPKQMRIKLSP